MGVAHWLGFGSSSLKKLTVFVPRGAATMGHVKDAVLAAASGSEAEREDVRVLDVWNGTVETLWQDHQLLSKHDKYDDLVVVEMASQGGSLSLEEPPSPHGTHGPAPPLGSLYSPKGVTVVPSVTVPVAHF